MIRKILLSAYPNQHVNLKLKSPSFLQKIMFGLFKFLFFKILLVVGKYFPIKQML